MRHNLFLCVLSVVFCICMLTACTDQLSDGIQKENVGDINGVSWDDSVGEPEVEDSELTTDNSAVNNNESENNNSDSGGVSNGDNVEIENDAQGTGMSDPHKFN